MSDTDESSTAEVFATNSDLFDAEIDSDGEANVNKDGEGELKEDDLVIENGENDDHNLDHEKRSDEDDPFPDSGSDEGEGDEGEKEKTKKTRVEPPFKKEPKKRKAKKEAMQLLHSESQRLVRESSVRLPYHQPASKDIGHFLKRVTVKNNKNNKLPRTDRPTKPASSEEDTDAIPEEKLESSQPEELQTTEDETNNETVVKPKLTLTEDSFFFPGSPAKKPAGLNNLMNRFFKHNGSKAKQNVKPEEVSKEQVAETEKPDVDEVTDEVEKLKTTDIGREQITESENAVVKSQKMSRPVFQRGDNLLSLKEKLQVNMKLKRAEVRKIYESQRKIDDEEISDEEEEEFEDDEDSDFEVDDWNVDDEKAQEERRQEAEEDEDGKTTNTPSNEETNSITDSDTNQWDFKRGTNSQHHSKPVYPDEQTIDLFPSDNSNQTANRTLDEDTLDNDRESVDSEPESIKLRLDSLEESQDCFGEKDETSTHGFTKLQMPGSNHDLSSDGSNLPNAQPERTGSSKMSVSLNTSSSNEGLTPFSRIQRLLGVDCSSAPRDKKPKPISELTMPVEDSQDLYDEDDVVDKRFSDGLNTSKDFSFALDEDTQFTQFVDTQGYLLSTTKKKRNKEAKSEQKPNNMSELLGLCSGSFSDQPKKTISSETQHDMSELLGLCSGKFTDTSNTEPITESQKNMNELLRVCSGKFTDEKPEAESQNMSELLGLCSGKFGDENTTKSTTDTQNMKELLGLCSGKFDDKKESVSDNSKVLFGPESKFNHQNESGVREEENMSELLGLCSGRFSCVGSAKNSGNDGSRESESGIFTELGQSNKRKPKQGLSAIFETMEGGESSMDDAVALCSGRFPATQKSKEQADSEMEDIEIAEKEGSDIEENSDAEKNSEEEVFSDDERQDGADDEMEDVEDGKRKSKKYGITYGKKAHSVFNKDNFVEDEAELSGSEASSDEEEGSEDDELEEDSDAEDLPSDDELQRQVNKVHMKSVIDEDKRELRELKERYLEDGDLYSEGGGRARNFKWQGLEDSQLDMFENKVLWGDDEIVDSALLTEAELERRKMKHERDQFLQDQLARTGGSQPTDVDENSQNILNLINDASSAGADGENDDIVEKPAPKRQDSTSTKASQKRGSFLTRSKGQMSRLSSVTAIKKTPNSTRGFVFQTISPSSKAKANPAQKLQRSASLSEPPNPKRPRLERTSSIATGSLFTAIEV